MSDRDLNIYIVMLFVAGYHTQSKQRLFKKKSLDVELIIAFKTICKNKFSLIKKYIHLSDHTTLDRSDKYAKDISFHN